MIPAQDLADLHAALCRLVGSIMLEPIPEIEKLTVAGEVAGKQCLFSITAKPSDFARASYELSMCSRMMLLSDSAHLALDRASVLFYGASRL